MQEKKIQVPRKKLNNGLMMPVIGLGTYLFEDEGQLREVVRSAVMDHGYRLIDTAAQYGNEKYIGNVLKECFGQGIKREDMFITTKLWIDDKENVEQALKKSIENLQCEYIDLYLIHWMNPIFDPVTNEVKKTPLETVWRQMEQCVDKGLTKSIGVSNCNMQLLLDLLTYCRYKPVVNQIELHPYNVQSEAVEFMKKLGIVAEAYAPFTSRAKSNKPENLQDLDVLQDPVVIKLADKYQRTPGQIVLNWQLYRDHVVIPKTTKKERLLENIDVFDFKLAKEEYKSITDLDKGARLFDPLYDKNFNFIPYWD